MRPVRVRVSAAGYSDWIPVNRLQNNFNVALGVVFSSGASLTATVQHTFDDLQDWQLATVTRSTTVATLKNVNHGLSVGDSVIVRGTGSSNLDGTFPVASVVDADRITYAVSNTGATADNGGSQVLKLRVFSHLVLNAITASLDSNYINPIAACRIYVSTYSSGFVDLLVQQGLGT